MNRYYITDQEQKRLHDDLIERIGLSPACIMYDCPIEKGENTGCEFCETNDDDFWERRKVLSWISIEDEPPLYDELILITNGNVVRQGVWDESDGYFYAIGVDNTSHDYVKVKMNATHWMPLPDLPNEKDSQ